MTLRSWVRVAMGIAVGALAERLPELLTGARLEYYQGLSTFDWRWFLGLSAWPVAGGLVCAFLIGRYGKWWSPGAALLLRSLLWSVALAGSCHYGCSPGPGPVVVPLGIWGGELLLCVDAAWVGGFLGERLRRDLDKSRSRRPARPAL